MSEAEKVPELTLEEDESGEKRPLSSFIISMAQRYEEIRKMLRAPIPPCAPDHALVMTRFVTWNIEGDTLHVHLDDTSGARSLSEKLRCIKRDFSYLAQALLGSPEVTSVIATSWIIGKNPQLIERLGFTPLGEIDDAEKQVSFPQESRSVGRAVIDKEAFIRRYFTSSFLEDL